MSTFTAANAFRDAMVTALGTLNPTGVLVTRGNPAYDVYPDVISVGAVGVQSEFATMSSNMRSREETLELPVTFSSWAEGGEEAEAVAQDRVYDMLAAAETYVRVTNTTLGGVVRQCFLTAHAGDDVTPPDLLHAGRLHLVIATFTAINRITGS